MNMNMKSFLPSLDSMWEMGVEGFNKQYFMHKKTIGKGPKSVIYRGESKENGVVGAGTVAIKVVDKTNLLEHDIDQLCNEVDILRSVSHPNILQLFDAYNDYGMNRYLMVSEYMGGGDLLGFMNKQTLLMEGMARDFCASVLSAVSHLQDHSVVHRDIKPENCLLSTSGGSLVLKLADFGFATRETTPNCLKTKCGSPSYVAPEIILGKYYGHKVDIWSVGILAYALLGGYLPFRGDGEADLNDSITSGKFEFEEEYWANKSLESKDFIETLLCVDPNERPSVEDVQAHPWFDTDISAHEDLQRQQNEKSPVFFMIGSQRSGSNWLRTMLDEREDLAAPHPPHVMRDFMPIIDKFGDLSQDEQFRILVDHVCTFVENNQVPWTDRHDKKIVFCRKTVYEQAKASCNRLLLNQEDPLEKELYLLSVFDAFMDFFTKANGKHIWICKSMGMSAYHKYLLRFYGEERLRYVYLIRDPRDVAMSFMKTPVGDCHYYAITKKWVGLQQHALRVLENTPELVTKVRYEDLLKDKEGVMEKIYEFIGARRFGGMARQASVVFMAPNEDLVNNAKNGNESIKAHTLSYQFKNLCRGDSFAREQNQKWKHPETGLKDEDLEIIESLAWEMIERFGYETKLIGKTIDPIHFSEDEIEEFDRLNRDGIKLMMETLKEENIEDYERRRCQAAVLRLEPTLLSGPELWNMEESALSKKKEIILAQVGEVDADFYLTEEGCGFSCGASSQKGYKPGDKKPNQDSFDIRIDINDSSSGFFGVYDGHGPAGHTCSKIAKSSIGEVFEEFRALGKTTKVALEKAHAKVHKLLVEEATIDTSVSGTTSVVAVLDSGKLTICHVGDSVAIIGDRQGKKCARFLFEPHDLSRVDELARIARSGGVIMSTDEYNEAVSVSSGTLSRQNSSSSLCNFSGSLISSPTEVLVNATSKERKLSRTNSVNSIASLAAAPLIKKGLSRAKSMHSFASSFNTIDFVEPYIPRIWSGNSLDKLPGCVFTRSLGDTVAHEIGVSSKPEFVQLKVEEGDIIILASDGVSEYLEPDDCIEIVTKFEDPADAAEALVKEAVEMWAEKNEYVDDATAIVIYVKSAIQ